MLEHLKAAEVDRSQQLRWVACARCDLDGGRNADAHSGRAQRCGEAARLEQWRKDPLRKPSRLVQRALNVAPHLFQEHLRRQRIGVRQLVRVLKVDGERDEVLLHALVQIMFD